MGSSKSSKLVDLHRALWAPKVAHLRQFKLSHVVCSALSRCYQHVYLHQSPFSIWFYYTAIGADKRTDDSANEAFKYELECGRKVHSSVSENIHQLVYVHILS